MQYIQEKYLSATCFENTVECISAAGMAAHNICRSANLVQCAFYHLVGYGICKKYQKIRTSYLFSEVGFHLCEDFAFTFIDLQIFLYCPTILSCPPTITILMYYPPFVLLDILILGLESIYPLPDNRALIILWVWLTFSNCKLV